MIDSLFNEYTNTLSPKALIGKHSNHFNKAYGAVFVEFLMFLVSLTLLYGNRPLWIRSLILVPIILIWLTAMVVNKLNRNVVLKHYKDKGTEMTWRGHLSRYRAKEFKKYLNSQGLLSGDALYTIINMLEERAGEQKFQGWFGTGLTLALIIPIWSQFVQLCLSKSLNVNFGIIIALGLVIFAVVVVWLISNTRSVMLDFIEKKYRKTKSVIDVLKEIHTELTIQQNRSSKKSSSSH